MKQFAVIGLGKLGQKVLELLSDYDCDVMIVDKDAELVEALRGFAGTSVIADALNEQVLIENLPKRLDAVVVDLGGHVEASILVTHYLKKMGHSEIVVKAESEVHQEILKIVGASDVILPDQEAAYKVTPMLVSSILFNLMPISNGLVLAELKVPDRYVGKTLVEANLRKEKGLNVVAIRKMGGANFEFFTPDYLLQESNVLLVVGKTEDVDQFSMIQDRVEQAKGPGLFHRLFKPKKKGSALP